MEQQPSSTLPAVRGLDHIAIVVRDTEEALAFYRDKLGLEVIFSEKIASGGVRLTHLDLGNIHLQLVQPLKEDHPLREHLSKFGEGLHHLCFSVSNIAGAVDECKVQGLRPLNLTPHDGPHGRKAAFLDPESTRGVVWEMTSDTLD